MIKQYHARYPPNVRQHTLGRFILRFFYFYLCGPGELGVKLLVVCMITPIISRKGRKARKERRKRKRKPIIPDPLCDLCGLCVKALARVRHDVADLTQSPHRKNEKKRTLTGTKLML